METKIVMRIAIRVLGLALACVLPSVATAQTEQVYYYHTDAVGSVRLITDANGQEVARYDYTPFGVQSGTTPVDPRLFAGKERDGESGFDYFGARYYQSQTGRFTTVDPVIPLQKALQEPQLWNRYAYVKNNPLRYTDPDGRCIWDLCIGEIAAATELSAATVAAFEATSAATAWMLSPPGRNATKALVADTASLITSAIDRFNIGSLWAESSPRVFEPNPKHGLTERGDVGAAPTNGQSALDDSVQVKGTSPRRVGVDRLNREIVVLDEHTPGKFHGHVREWEKLTDEMRNALIRSRLTDRRGNILPQEPK